MVIDNKFNLGDKVYLETDKEQSERIVTGLRVGKYDIVYQLNCGETESCHYDFEITTERNIITN